MTDNSKNMNKDRLRTIIEGNICSGFIQFLILASAVTFVIESDRQQLEVDPYATHFIILDVTFLVLFSIEYALRVYIEPRKRDFIFSFYGMIDLLAILPSLFLVPGFRVFADPSVFANFQGIQGDAVYFSGRPTHRSTT